MIWISTDDVEWSDYSLTLSIQIHSLGSELRILTQQSRSATFLLSSKNDSRY